MLLPKKLVVPVAIGLEALATADAVKGVEKGAGGAAAAAVPLPLFCPNTISFTFDTDVVTEAVVACTDDEDAGALFTVENAPAPPNPPKPLSGAPPNFAAGCPVENAFEVAAAFECSAKPDGGIAGMSNMA